MIHIEDDQKRWEPELPLCKYLSKCNGTKEKIFKTIDVIKQLDIDGCITGSCWLPGFDPDGWGTTPDVDVFVYSENELVKAVNIAEHKLKMTPGKGTERTEKQERWKLKRLYKSGLNRKIGITTYTFYCDGIMLNITHKMGSKNGHKWTLCNAPSILMSFDMSIVMQGYDIQSHTFFDLRPAGVSDNVAVPNPLRDHDCVMWTVAKWVRQFDRVIKYYNRGFDTRPMARFYLDMIDECIDAGCLFDSEESQEAFTKFSEEFIEKRASIADWLEAHKDDDVFIPIDKEE